MRDGAHEGQGGPRAAHPRWTPDGEHVVYVSDDGVNRDLALFDPKRGESAEITAGGIYTHPVWQPAG